MDEVLVDMWLEWDLHAQVMGRDGRLVLRPDAASDVLVALSEPVRLLDGWPHWLAGVLPEGVVGVEADGASPFREPVVAGGVWLTGAKQLPDRDALRGVWFVESDGGRTPLPALPAADQAALDRHFAPGLPDPILDDLGRAYAQALADALAADLAAHPVAGALRRVVIRWFWEGDPRHLTLHALGSDDPQPGADDAWYPLEWAVVDREMDRTDRVLERAEVAATSEALAASFPTDDDGLPDGEAHVPAVMETLRRLPDALDAARVACEPSFAVAAAHFEGWVVRAALEATATPEVLAELAERGELPED